MASLEIHLNDIPPEGLDYVREISRIDLDLEEGDANFQGNLEFSGHIHAAENEAWVDGDLSGVLILECVRCLGLFDWKFRIPIGAYYRSQDAVQTKDKRSRSKKEDSENEGEEADHFPILDHSLNLADMLREQVILSIPFQPLCKDSCQGICQVCGQNRNQQPCECEVVGPESPFAVLRHKLDFSKRTKK
jgi:DUF177 domain-containing protein